VGRAGVFALVTVFFLFYLTEVIDLPNWALAVLSTLILVARLFDAVMGIVLGSLMDNIRARWGRPGPGCGSPWWWWWS
jgi:melibiose permease/lactose/raffinose/galactose permease